MERIIRVKNVDILNTCRLKETFKVEGCGKAALVAGVATVLTPIITNKSIVLLTVQNANGTPGLLRVSNAVSETSFQINSSSSSDTSVIGWFIVDTIN